MLLDRKNSATKKVPNFAEIHKRIFAKSESIVDAKRRIEKKHLTLSKYIRMLLQDSLFDFNFRFSGILLPICFNVCLSFSYYTK